MAKLDLGEIRQEYVYWISLVQNLDNFFAFFNTAMYFCSYKMGRIFSLA